jgi:hypothetical protein
MAAQFFNLCRSRGIQGSNTDFLICACSVKWLEYLISAQWIEGVEVKLIFVE